MEDLRLDELGEDADADADADEEDGEDRGLGLFFDIYAQPINQQHYPNKIKIYQKKLTRATVPQLRFTDCESLQFAIK